MGGEAVIDLAPVLIVCARADRPGVLLLA